MAFFYILNMKNPKVNRLIGYLILFIGFVIFYRGAQPVSVTDNPADANFFLIAVSFVFIVGSIVWMVKKVRCPHCNHLLHLKLYNIDVCPNCGKSTDSEK